LSFQGSTKILILLLLIAALALDDLSFKSVRTLAGGLLKVPEQRAGSYLHADKSLPQVFGQARRWGRGERVYRCLLVHGATVAALVLAVQIVNGLPPLRQLLWRGMSTAWGTALPGAPVVCWQCLWRDADGRSFDGHRSMSFLLRSQYTIATRVKRRDLAIWNAVHDLDNRAIFCLTGFACIAVRVPLHNSFVCGIVYTVQRAPQPACCLADTRCQPAEGAGDSSNHRYLLSNSIRNPARRR
jgi:hypothetical protein